MSALRNLWLTRFLPAALFASVVALYNGFPLTYPDSGNYLENAFAIAHGRMPWFYYRPLFYGGLLTPFASFPMIWLVPVVQGLLLAYTVDLTLRVVGVPMSTLGFLALFGGLSALTSLSWFSGQIMPDVFTGAVILLSFALSWDDEHRSLLQRCVVGILLAFALGSHLSHLAIYATLAVAALAGRAVADRAYRSWRRCAPLAAGALTPLVAAVGLLAASNAYAYREPTLSRSSSLFLLAHLVGDGLAQRYLAGACAVERYLLCSERRSLRPDLDWFLWDVDGPWKRHEPAVQHGDSTFLREAGAIARGTLRQEWPAEIRLTLRHAIVQLGMLGIHPGELTFSSSVAQALRQLGPDAEAAYRNSRQVRQSLPLDAVTRVQYAAFVLAALVLLVCLPALRGRSRLLALIATVCVGIALNALVIASLATVHPRYQSRVAWLLPLIAVAAALETFRARGPWRLAVQKPTAR